MSQGTVSLPDSLYALLQSQARRAPEAPALLAPERAPLTYDRLLAHVDTTRQALARCGLRRAERVALVLPQGPEMATAFLAVAAGAACAPLPPTASADDYAWSLADLQVQTLLLAADLDSPVRQVAQDYGLRVLEVAPQLQEAAGLFTLHGEVSAPAALLPLTQPDDIALLLHTAGSTARPKLVPLTQAQVCAGAWHTSLALELRASDRCLNVMPLFHVHGLIGAFLASLLVGASVVCTPGFLPQAFVSWLEAFQPTWYTAVPTMHQALLAQAAGHPDILARCRLRFVRSAAFALPAAVFEDLERTFQAPVIEAYGMTEAASQITSNPLPPRQRKRGSVGVAVGPELAILDATGTALPPDTVGEIVIRGPHIMRAYAHNPEADQEAFSAGWFRTGDQGFVDADGYLFITGRTKDLINRGGVKIAPQEVDAVLLEHPAVAEAAVFAVPHPTLGEDMAAAVVLHPQPAVTPSALRAFVAARVAPFKVPRRLYVVERLPRSAVGKLQRFALAAQLHDSGFQALAAEPPAAGPAARTPTEERLLAIWQEVLSREEIGRHEDFFALGGESFHATHLLHRLRETMSLTLSLPQLFAMPTIAALAGHIDTLQAQAQHVRETMIPPRPSARRPVASVTQEHLWRLAQLAPESACLHTAYAVRLQGTLQVTALEESLNQLLARHEALRTTFRASDGQLLQSIAPSLRLTLAAVDLTAMPRAAREGHVAQLLQAAAQQPFSLSRGPLVRLGLWRLEAEEHLLLLVLHHLLSDRWSLGVFLRELALGYQAITAGVPVVFPALPVQYADVVHWQRHWPRSATLRGQLAYWKQQLRGPLRPLSLPGIRRRRAPTARGMARLAFTIPPPLVTDLVRLSHHTGSTLFMTLTAALNVLLYRYTGQTDLRLIIPVANRQQPGTAQLIGYFTNLVVLRTNLAGDPTCREVLQRVRSAALAAYAHQELPFEELLRVLEAERGLDRTTLAPCMTVWQHDILSTLPLCDGPLHVLEATPFTWAPDVPVAVFDLILTWRAKAFGLDGSWLYDTARFDKAMLDRMLGDLRQVLRGFGTQPEQRLSALGARAL